MFWQLKLRTFQTGLRLSVFVFLSKELSTHGYTEVELAPVPGDADEGDDDDNDGTER